MKNLTKCEWKDCENLCTGMYCSARCRNRAWKKSKTFLNKKCKIKTCRKPCRNKYCSKECESKAKKIIRLDNCLTCGKEFQYKPYDKKRGEAKYCSLECRNRSYYFDWDFFKQKDNAELAYEILGFVFSNGVISDYMMSRISIVSDKQYLENFINLTKTTYPIIEIPIRYKKDKYKYKIIIMSTKLVEYLVDTGLTKSIQTNEFPCILPEYKKYFIRGLLYNNNSKIQEKDDYNLITISTSSMDIAKHVSELMNGIVITKSLEHLVVFKDYEKFFSKFLLQETDTVLENLINIS